MTKKQLKQKQFRHQLNIIVNGGKLLTKLSKTWKYSQTTSKRPPKMQRFTGKIVPRALLPGLEKHAGDEVDLQEVVSYKNQTTGVSSEPEIQVNILYSASFSIFPYMCSSLLSINVCEHHCTYIENRYQTIHLEIAYKRLKTQLKIVKLSSP